MIVKFKREYLDRIMEIWLNTNVLAHSFIKENYWKDNFYIVKEMITEAEIYVFIEENIIKGFVGIYQGHIEGIFVDKKYQGQNIGKYLLNMAKELHPRLTLNVYLKNSHALEFYKSQNFKIIKENLDENTVEKECLMSWEK